MVAPFTLYQAKVDYYALGHIHMPQMVAPSMYYSGSLYNCNWGETEQKSFNVVEFCEESYDNFLREEPYKPKVEIIPLVSARPMITLDMDFHESAVEMIMSNRQNLSTSEIDAITNSKAEIRLKIKIKENDRKLLTDTYIEELKNSWGEDVKIDWNIIPSERESRSENIMNCKSLTDEVKEYASVVNEEVTDSMIEKILKIQGREVAA
jgi:DNA repair exonuclease SbcCD nuclease subunit